MSLDIGLINIPRLPSLLSSLRSQLLREQWGKLSFPVSDGFMCERKTSLRKHFSYVTQTQFIAQTPYNREQDNISREFKVVERRASSFIENTAAARAEERGVAEFGFLCSLLGGSYHTIGTVHQLMLLVQLSFEKRSITEVCPLCQDGA
jgi:hypothetical protein